MHEGIKHQKIAQYTTQQNGVSKQLNHTIMECARSMLSIYGLDNQLWAEVVNIMSYSTNRLPTITLDG